MSETISTLADVSTMWLVCISFILCLIPLAIVGGMVFAMHKFLGTLPPIFQKGQEGIANIADGADRASNTVAAPFTAASARASQFKGSMRSLINMSRRKE
jgi:hypothetical protein